MSSLCSNKISFSNSLRKDRHGTWYEPLAQYSSMKRGFGRPQQIRMVSNMQATRRKYRNAMLVFVGLALSFFHALVSSEFPNSVGQRPHQRHISLEQLKMSESLVVWSCVMSCVAISVPAPLDSVRLLSLLVVGLHHTSNTLVG